MPETLPLFVAIDGRHACLLAPMTMSVLEHARDRVAFHVLGDGLAARDAESLHCLVRRHAGATIVFHDASGFGDRFAGCSRGWFRNDVVFARLMIPDGFPEIDRAIYMDVDTLALGDIGGIMDIGTGPHGIAAAADMGVRYYVNTARHRCRLGLPDAHIYFNNGVLLLDCRWWRREQALGQILAIARARRDDVWFPTQDPMNMFFSPNRYTLLPPRYNSMPFGGRPVAEGVVLHFTGEKPWEDPSLPSASLFHSYADRSPFAEAIRSLTIQGSLRRSLGRAWRSSKRAWHDIGNSLAPGAVRHG